MIKRNKVPILVTITAPRGSGSIRQPIQLDPNSLFISGNPTAKEVAQAVRETVIDKIKVKIFNGREALKAVKAYQKKIKAP